MAAFGYVNSKVVIVGRKALKEAVFNSAQMEHVETSFQLNYTIGQPDSYIVAIHSNGLL